MKGKPIRRNSAKVRMDMWQHPIFSKPNVASTCKEFLPLPLKNQLSLLITFPTKNV
jgi:hypothetical protein